MPCRRLSRSTMLRTAARAASIRSGTNAGADLIAVGVEMPDHRAGCRHWTLDGRPTDLTVALCGVRVTYREQCARNLDRQVQFGSCGKVAYVHVATHAAGRDDAMQA